MPQFVPEAYSEIRVKVPKELVEIACDFIIENIASGVVLEEEEGASHTTIIFYVPEGGSRYQELLADFFAGHGWSMPSQAPELRSKRVTNTEWLDQYRESVKLIRISDDVVVRPPWIEPTADKYQIVLEPKMAFGTGSHATTRSCLKVVREKFQPGCRFLDIGCGSGIVSILADQMGASFIKAIDYDLAAVANCRENFAINGVKAPHEITVGSIEKCARDDQYQFVCANIILSTILTMLHRLVRLTAPGGLLILSGLLEKDVEAMNLALVQVDQSDFSVIHDEEWRTFVVVRR